MNALLAKEIRLLLPAYAAALLLAVVSGWLTPLDPFAVILPILVGVILLALSVFGREFALNTFPMVMAQPQKRARTWWTKIAVLGVAVLTLLAVWAAVRIGLRMGAAVYDEGLTEGAMLILMVLVTGLWTTLLLRQVIAAFWFTLFLPAVILALVGRSPTLLIAVPLLYSAAAFVWAWRYFLRLQETAWTGGVVTVPGWTSAAGAERAALRSPRPLAALVLKELQLQHLSLLGIGCLFLLHLVVLFIRRAGLESFGYGARSALEAFGGIWLLVPFILSATALAEERKLGTADGLRSLPVSARIQFGIKLAFVLLVGGLLSPLLLWTVEAIGRTMGAPANIGGLDMGAGPWVLEFLCLVFLALSLASFYGSTLARNVVQALAAGVLVTFILWQLGLMASRPDYFLGVRVWEGALVHYIAWPVLIVVISWLAWRNFRCGAEPRHFWRRNLVGLALTLIGISVVTSAIFNRAWEFILPLEPPHGPARLTLQDPPKVRSYAGSSLAVVLPSGSAWVDRLSCERGTLILDVVGEQTGFRVGGKWLSLEQNPYLPGTNWVDAFASYRETVAIRSDGSLWVSERPRHGERDRPEMAAPLVRIGNESDWQKVIRDFTEDAISVVLLKRDGTLWRWKWQANPKSEPGLRNSEPHRLGTDSDWSSILEAGSSIYLWKSDGTAWVLHGPARQPKKPEVQLEPGTVLSRCPVFDNTRWTSMARWWPLQAGVRDDGTLWAWTTAAPSGADDGFQLGKPVQIGKNQHWLRTAGGWQTLGALKSDGSLWVWEMREWRPDLTRLTTQPPRRLGSHSDWVAIGSVFGGIASVAGDGSLWYWWERANIYDSPQPMISAPRKPVKLANLLEQLAEGGVSQK